MTLKLSDLERFTTRASTKRAHDAVAVAHAEAHAHGRNVTGLTFGRRGAAVYARICDKTKQAEDHAPIRQVWAAVGDAPAHGAVHMVELELRSAFLNGFSHRGVPMPLAPLEVLSLHLDDLWGSLLGRWLVLRDEHDLRGRIERRDVEP